LANAQRESKQCDAILDNFQRKMGSPFMTDSRGKQLRHALTEIHWVRIAAWLIAVATFLNALGFVLRCSNPVIRSDAWYFLDAFLSKAMDGSLGIADFFVKRADFDHAQPLFKLEMLLEWRYFGLDFTVGAVIGVIAAAVSAAIFYRLTVAGGRDRAVRYLAWAAMCAVLFSLNAGGAIWTWPLVALENVTNLIILMFMLAVWHAHRSQRYLILTVVSLLLGISSDDSALIAVTVTVLVLLLAQFSDPEQRRSSTWKLLTVLAACMLLVRLGYRYAPVTGVPVATPYHLDLLIERFRAGGWWQWLALPLILPVSYSSISAQISTTAWIGIQAVVAMFLLVAHVWFWWRALRGKYTQSIFVAVCLMALSYAWVAGIIFGRVSVYGNDYLYQQRYVLLYSGHLLALLLMWASSHDALPEAAHSRCTAVNWIPIAGCLSLLLIQISASRHSWQQRPYLWAYYSAMAQQIDNLAKDPADTTGCLPELSVCGWPLDGRRHLTQILNDNRLNVFSLRVQHRHRYLPHLSPLPLRPATLQSTQSPGAHE
jgi:hypothetical protein